MEIETPQHRDSYQPNDLEYALATLGRKAIRIEHLEDENTSLRAQLGAIPPKHPATANRNLLASPAPSSQDTNPANSILAAQHEGLKLQLAELQASHAALKEQHDLVRKKFKESKALIKQWQAYLKEKRERDGKGRDGDPLSTPPPPDTVEQRKGMTPADMDGTPRASTDTAAPDPAYSNHEQHALPEMTSSPPRLTVGPDGYVSFPAPQTRSQQRETITSSQTTVDEPETREIVPVPEQSAPTSDFEPVVVSSRCLKRKADTEGGRNSPRRRIKQEPSSPNTPMGHQSEVSRHPPEFRVDATSSDDCLDNFGPAMKTPRRPKRVSDLRLRATEEEVLRTPPQLQRSASSLSDGNAGSLFEQSTLPMPSTFHVGQENSCRSEQDNGSSSLQPSRHQRFDALKPISGNVPRQQRISAGQDKPKLKFRATCVKEKILLVSEDGDGGSQSATCLERQVNAPSPGLAIDERLDYLLNGPSLNRTLSMPLAIASAETSPMGQVRPSSAQLRTPVSVVKRTSPVKPTTTLGRTGVRPRSPQSGRPKNAVRLSDGPGRSPPVVRPEEEPLRIRSATSLRLEDFKINPMYMGTEFAFADTIRGRDARQNLHACTRADCCGGALEKVIRMGGTAMSGRTDAHALEAFIGPAWQALMSATKPDEAKRLLQQAHAFCFANEHGKHRQAFERRSTPPGYWRADFPTTQEQATDRKTAQEMQEKEVENRHREAMREGGRWVFRDE